VSVDVGLDRLRETTSRVGTSAFLLTVRDGTRPHVVSVDAVWEGDDLVVEVGRRSAANAAAQASVTLLWPGPTDDGFSLIVDATAHHEGPAGDDGARLRIRPVKAVLHRSRAAIAPGSVGSDCRPVLDPPTA
jgi:hypothetical protein